MRQALDSIRDRPVLALLLAGLVLRATIAACLPAGFDEAYYYVYTLHPSWSYFDHPPLVALTTGLGPWLTGNVSAFTIRIGSLLLYTGSLLLLYLTGLTLFGRSAARLTLTLASLIPIFQLGFGVLTLPDSPLIFFWSACLYCAAQEFFGDLKGGYQPSYRLALIGLLVGGACLSKYHGLALGLGLVGFCGLNRKYRSALRSGWAGLAIGLFLLTIAPVLLWNAQHGWISFVYQSSRAAPAPYHWTQALVTVLVGIAYLFPSFGGPLWWAIGVNCRRIAQSVRRDSKPSNYHSASDWQSDALKYQFLLWLSLPLILVFIYIGGYQPVLPTWQMPGFWSAVLLLGDRAARWQVQSPRAVRRWLVSSGAIVITLLLVTLSHVSAGSLQKPNGWFGGIIPIAQDGSTQTIDIQQLRQGFLDQPQLHQALQQAEFVFTNQIFLAGQVAMALTPLSPAPITCFSDDLRGFAFWSSSTDWLGKSALYITTTRFAQEADRLHPYRNYFRAIVPIGNIPIQRGGQTVEVFHVFRAIDLQTPYPRPYGK